MDGQLGSRLDELGRAARRKRFPRKDEKEGKQVRRERPSVPAAKTASMQAGSRGGVICLERPSSWRRGG